MPVAPEDPLNESLRRKFKVVYSTRKPTGMRDMPPHIKHAKELKKPLTTKRMSSSWMTMPTTTTATNAPWSPTSPLSPIQKTSSRTVMTKACVLFPNPPYQDSTTRSAVPSPCQASHRRPRTRRAVENFKTCLLRL
ncbi:hypothetical protein F443_02046 [Phytophthora nicotianae P1569]|uniref:DUF6818 domain-containing protein n=1 Tax=Phytophthora nicotianae P1569 TaxID=1317065 RepID=V9FUU1_PHYNI|nr:hypothetical protein F443_02046 [Phytophthora nicotianae P1569]